MGALPLHPWSVMGAADPGAVALRPSLPGVTRIGFSRGTMADGLHVG